MINIQQTVLGSGEIRIAIGLPISGFLIWSLSMNCILAYWTMGIHWQNEICYKHASPQYHAGHTCTCLHSVNWGTISFHWRKNIQSIYKWSHLHWTNRVNHSLWLFPHLWQQCTATFHFKTGGSVYITYNIRQKHFQSRSQNILYTLSINNILICISN